jgi:hypothetical protein
MNSINRPSSEAGLVAAMKPLLPCLLFLLAACSSATQIPARSVDGAAGAYTPPTEPAGAVPDYAGCYYVWAEQDIPGLSEELDRSLQAVSPDLSGSAYAFGEDCVYADGRREFGAMETDFRVQVKVKDLKDEKTLGNWMVKTMQVIEGLPRDELQGGRPGTVQFNFIKSDTENLYLSVSLEEYRTAARGLEGAELFRHFHKNP